MAPESYAHAATDEPTELHRHGGGAGSTGLGFWALFAAISLVAFALMTQLAS